MPDQATQKRLQLDRKMRPLEAQAKHIGGKAGRRWLRNRTNYAALANEHCTT